MSLYNKEFYEYIDAGAIRSAEIIVPLILENFIVPESVIDFGCGTGAWLHVFQSHGVQEVYGVDGSDQGHQLIDDLDFELYDLSEPFVPLHKYDLAITLEVAEHLPESAADTFVANVARCSDNILWSAAVPGQRGLNHINEQFPSYWVPKFEALGYSCNGDFRKIFWYNEDVENWYRQNILLFSKTRTWDNPVQDLIHYNNYPNYGGNVEEQYRYE